MSVTALAEWAAGVHSLPKLVSERLELVLASVLGVTTAGAAGREALIEAWDPAPGPCVLIGTGRSTTPDTAAWLNATALVSLELDEGNRFAGGHPAAHGWPAVLALAAARSADGPTTAAALVVAYEVAARFGRATRLRPGTHPHGTWGATGAAAGCARLLGLPTPAMAAAIDAAAAMAIASPFAAALDGNPIRDEWVGAANQAGLAAARLAAAHHTTAPASPAPAPAARVSAVPASAASASVAPAPAASAAAAAPAPAARVSAAPASAASALPASALPASAPLASAPTASAWPLGVARHSLGGLLGRLDEDELSVALGERWDLELGYFKRHASCAYTHPAADAVLDLRAGINPGDVERIDVETYSAAAALVRTDCPTRLAAMFSLPFVVATVLREGAVRPDAFARVDAARPLMERVHVTAAADLDALVPEHRGARVRVTLRDGSAVEAAVRDPIGDTARGPFGRAELAALLGRADLAPLLGPDAGRFFDIARDLLRARSVRDVLASL